MQSSRCSARDIEITGDFVESEDVGIAVVCGSREGRWSPCACRCWVVVKGLREGSGVRSVSGLKDTITVSGLITNGICVVEEKGLVTVSGKSCGVESELNAVGAQSQRADGCGARDNGAGAVGCCGEGETPFKVFDGLSGVERTGCGVEGKDSGIGLEGGSCCEGGSTYATASG